MRLELGSPVWCADGPVGELADVVIDPLRQRVTHVVVEPHHRPGLARLVPIELVGEKGGWPPTLGLRCTTAELRRLDPVEEFADLRMDELPGLDGDWDMGVQDVYPMAEHDFGAMTYGSMDPHVWVSYDRVPKGEIELRRRSPVSYADGRHAGHVQGFVVDPGERITDVLVERGHLWTRKQLAIPVGAVARLQTDEVTLRATKAEAGT